MKVLHISAGALWGGVERVLATLACYRAHCPTMQPHFAVCFAGRLSHELRAAGVPVYILGGIRVSNPFSVLRARANLRHVFLEHTFDVAVCHLPWAHALFAPVAAAAEVPAFFWMHGFATGRHWTERWARRTLPAAVICNSHATAATARTLFPDTKVHVLYNPVPSGTALSRRPHQPPVIVQVSRMEPWKGHELHLQALALLPKQLDWHCRFIGGAQRPAEIRYIDRLRAQAARLGLDKRVEFPGESANVSQELASADIFCQPNTSPEPFGLVFIEALFAGLPVVATRLGAAPEILDAACGVLVDPADPRALAEALSRLLQDQPLRDRLGSAGPAHAHALCDTTRQIPLLYRLLSSR